MEILDHEKNLYIERSSYLYERLAKVVEVNNAFYKHLEELSPSNSDEYHKLLELFKANIDQASLALYEAKIGDDKIVRLHEANLGSRKSALQKLFEALKNMTSENLTSQVNELNALIRLWEEEPDQFEKFAVNEILRLSRNIMDTSRQLKKLDCENKQHKLISDEKIAALSSELELALMRSREEVRNESFHADVQTDEPLVTDHE
ncbi:hypothetical protein Ciccas_008339, partial [Cichlidogyrus casuarinus]